MVLFITKKRPAGFTFCCTHFSSLSNDLLSTGGSCCPWGGLAGVQFCSGCWRSMCLYGRGSSADGLLQRRSHQTAQNPAGEGKAHTSWLSYSVRLPACVLQQRCNMVDAYICSYVTHVSCITRQLFGQSPNKNKKENKSRYSSSRYLDNFSVVHNLSSVRHSVHVWKRIGSRMVPGSSVTTQICCI